MSDKVVPFDPQSLAGALRERIRDSLGQLIPDDQWEAMMKREIASFFNAEPNQYGQARAVSGFGHVVLEVARDEARKRMLAYVETSPEWRTQMDPGGQYAPEKVLVDALAKATPDLVTAVLGGFCKGLSNQVQYAVQQSLSR